MGFLSKTRQIHKTIQNVQRLRQILVIFAKFGFQEIIARTQIEKFLPSVLSSDEVKAEPLAGIASLEERLRKAFEACGTTFIKLGQFMASRSDLFGEALAQEFAGLEDDVLALPFFVIQQVLEEELKKPIKEVFKKVDEQAIASASIAQVHRAWFDGVANPVVVKVQKPGIQKLLETDLHLIMVLVEYLERALPEVKNFDLKILCSEFLALMQQELNYTFEANNMMRIAHNLKEYPNIIIPHVMVEYSTKKVLVMQEIQGIRLRDVRDVQNLDVSGLIEMGAKAFLKTLLIDGVFHGDLHPGNVFLMQDGKLGIIDFGLVGRISPHVQDQLASLLVALIQEDYEHLAYELLEINDRDASTHVQQFQRDIRYALSPYMGCGVPAVKLGDLLMEAVRIASTHRIRIPLDWLLIFKSILNLEILGRLLNPQFNFFELGKTFSVEFLKRTTSWERIQQETVWIFKDLSFLVRNFPKDMRWFLKKLNRDNFSWEMKLAQWSEMQKLTTHIFERLNLTLYVGFLMIASSIALLKPQEDVGRLGLSSFSALCLFAASAISVYLYWTRPRG